MVTLLDVLAFAPLGRLCNRFSVEFKLLGGAMTRLVEHIGGADPTGDNLREIDLFALAPGFSELDVSHSGPPELRTEIAGAILDQVPNAECVRWDLRSESEWAIYRQAEHFNNRIPTRAMSLSTDPNIGFRDPLNGSGDIKEGSYRYERNPGYAAFTSKGATSN